MTEGRLMALGGLILFLVGLLIGISSATTSEEARCKKEHAAALANVDVGQKCAVVLEGCMSTLRTCTEALQKGVVKP